MSVQADTARHDRTNSRTSRSSMTHGGGSGVRGQEEPVGVPA